MATSLLHQQECLFNGGSLDVGRINNEEKGHNNDDGCCPEYCAWVMIYFKFQSWSKTSLERKDFREQMSSLFVESEMWMFSLFSILSDVPHLLLPVILCSCGCGTLQMVKQGCGRVTLHPVAQDDVSTFLWWCHFPQSFHHTGVLRRWGVESFWRAVGPDAFAHGSRMFSAEPQKRAAVWNGSTFRDSPIWVNVVQVNSQLKHSVAHEHELTQPVLPCGIFTSFDLWLYKTFSPQRVNLKNPKTVDCAWVMKELQERCLPLYFMDEKSQSGRFSLIHLDMQWETSAFLFWQWEQWDFTHTLYFSSGKVFCAGRRQTHHHLVCQQWKIPTLQV